MNDTKYVALRDFLLNSYVTELDIRNDEYLNGQCQLVSAGLMNYLPHIAVAEHEAIYKQILLHKKLSRIEQAEYAALNYLETEGCAEEVLHLLRRKPAVICTFHTGSYRVLNLFLYSQRVPFTLVMSKHVMETEGNDLSRLFDQLPPGGGTEELKIINAEAPNAGLQMLRELKAGRSLVVYMDGNAGAGERTSRNENSCIVDFLQQQVYARKGIGYIAHLAKVPLVPVFSYRKNREDIGLHFFQPIFPDPVRDRELFAVETLQLIYNFAGLFIEQYPGQWEGWLYIHKTAKIINETVPDLRRENSKMVPQKIWFNSTRFGIFKIQGKPFLLRKHNYSFYEISNELYELLNSCIDAAIDMTHIDSHVRSELCKEGVLYCL